MPNPAKPANLDGWDSLDGVTVAPKLNEDAGELVVEDEPKAKGFSDFGLSLSFSVPEKSVLEEKLNAPPDFGVLETALVPNLALVKDDVPESDPVLFSPKKDAVLAAMFEGLPKAEKAALDESF